MKLPKLKLPRFRLPGFRKKDAGDGEPAPPAEPKPKKGGPSLALILFVLVLAGLAGTASWLMVNASATEERMKARVPQVVLPLPVAGPTGPASSILPTAEAEPMDGEDGEEGAEGEGMVADAGKGGMAAEPEDDSHDNDMGETQELAEGGRPEGALPEAPLPGLQEETESGPLPKIGPDGTQPWQAYSRPFDDEEQRPRIALLVFHMGLARQPTRAAIDDLPPEVSFGFSPYADDLEEWVDTARRNGHEVFLDLPMEPENYPQDDPGPAALMTDSADDINLNRLDWVMSRAPGFAGLLSSSGSKFLVFQAGLDPVMEGLKKRGLMFVDGRAIQSSIAAGAAADKAVPRAYVNGRLDRELTPAAIETELGKLANMAERTGFAIGMISANPLSIKVLAEALPRVLSDKFALAPVSAIANKQPLLR